MSELIPISALIGDRTFRIKVEPKNEEQVRRTLDLINTKILEFKQQFAGKDMQDYLAMTLLWFATQPAATTSQATTDTPAQSTAGASSSTEISQELREGLVLIEKLLDEALRSS